MKTTSESVRDAFHYLYPDELPFLKKLVASIKNDNPIVVNIGAGSGTSGLAILESRPYVTLVTIDITDESSPFGCLAAERQVVTNAGFGNLFGIRWFQIHARSQEVAKSWGKTTLVDKLMGKVDMVFVDGGHSYQDCYDDVHGWLPHIVPGGVLAVHDYNKQMIAHNADGPHPKPWFDVNKVVDEELVGRYRMIGCVDSLIAFMIQDLE